MTEMNRNRFCRDSFVLCPVTDFSIFTGFSCLTEACTDRDLEEFLHCDAEKHYLDKIAITYSLTEESAPHFPLGFVTLQNDAIIINNKDEFLEEVKNYSYQSFPAVKIGRLGIHVKLQGKKLGSLLLNMVKEMMVTENRTGCRFLTVDAWRNKKQKINVSSFYSKNGFKLLALREKTSSTVPMYFDLADVSI